MSLAGPNSRFALEGGIKQSSKTRDRLCKIVRGHNEKVS